MKRIFYLAGLSLALGAHAMSDTAKIWTSGLEFLIRENRTAYYETLQSEALKDTQLTAEIYRWLFERASERHQRVDFNKLAYDVKNSLCSTSKARACKEFMDLWTSSLSSLLFFESSSPRLFKAETLIQQKNCGEAASVLKEIERSEGHCIPVLEAWVEVKNCLNDSETIEATREEIRELKGLENAR